MKMTLDASGYMSGIEKATSATNQMAGGLTGSLSKAKGDFASIGKDLGNSLTQGLEQRFGALGGIAGSLASALGPIGIAGLAAGAALAAVGVASVQAASGWQTLMAGVAKTTGLSESTGLNELSADLLEMSTRMPTAAADLAKIAGVAGSLGVAKENIAGFTEAASMMAVGFEMSAEEAATASAKILTAFGKPIDTTNMMAFGNVVNSMGDNFAATEAQVMDFTNRASFLSATFGQTIPQVAALGTTLISVGMSSETASTGIKSFLNTALKEGGAGAKALADLWGQSTEAVNKAFGQDLTGSMVKTADMIAQIKDPVERFNAAVAIAGTEGATALLKLAGQGENLQKALTAANSEWANGSSLMKTYEAQSATLDSKMSMFSNTLHMIGVSIGTPMLPWISGAVGGLTSLTTAAFNTGKAFVGIVQNSDAFKALGEAASSVGSAIGSVFGNLVSVIRPVWDALGGGNAAMSALQAGVDAATAGLTLFLKGVTAVANGIVVFENAIAPVASAIGEGLGGAIKTTQAYMQAFGEAITDLVTKSSTFQALSTAFDSVKSGILSAIEGIKSGISGVVSWISDAFQKAVQAVVGIFGDMGSGAAEGFKTAIENSPVGGLLGFASGIADRAGQIMANGKETGDKVGEGVKESDALATAPGEVLGSDKALTAVGEAGKEAAKKYENQFQEQAGRSGLSGEALLGMINSQSTPDSNIKKTVFDLYGKAVEYWYDAAEKAPITMMSIDGTRVFSKRRGTSSVWTPAQVLDMLGLPQPEKISEVAKMEGNAAAAAIQEVKDAASAADEHIFDLSPALANIDSFSTQLSTRFKGLVSNIEREILALGNVPAYDKTRAVWTEQGQKLIDALAKPVSLEGFAAVTSGLDGVTDWMDTWATTYGDTAEKATFEYKEKLLAGIADTSTYVKTEMARMGSAADRAFKDSFISDDEKTMLLGLEPQLDFLRQNFPQEFDKVGGDSIQAMIDALKRGDLPGAMAAIGKQAGKDFKENVLGGMSNTVKELKDIINDPTLLQNSIADPMRFYTGTIAPALKKMGEDGAAALASGQSNANQLYKEYVGQLYKIYNMVPSYVQKAIDLFATINPATGRGYISWQQMNGAIEQYNTQLTGATSTTQANVAATNTATSAIKDYDSAYKFLTTAKKEGNAVDAQTQSTLDGLYSKYRDGTLTADQYKNKIVEVAQATQSSTGQFHLMNGEISQFGTISGTGLDVRFAPAEVVGDKAKQSLIEGTDYFKGGMHDILVEFTSLKAVPGWKVGDPYPTEYGTSTGTRTSTGEKLAPYTRIEYDTLDKAIPVTITNTASNPAIIKDPYDAVKMDYSGSQWLKDYGTTPQDFVKISGPSGQLRSPSKGTGFTYTETGNAPVDYLSPEQKPLGSVDSAALIAYYNSLNLSLKPTGSLASNVQDLTIAANSANAATTKTNAKIDDTKSQLTDLGNGLYKLTNPIGDACVQSEFFTEQMKESNGMFKETSITFQDKLTPAQRAAYESTFNLATKTSDLGLCVTDTAGFSQNLQIALDKTGTSFVGRTSDYERLGLSLDGSAVPLGNMNREVTVLGGNIGTTSQGVTVLGDSSRATGVTVGGLSQDVTTLGDTAVRGSYSFKLAVSTWDGVISDAVQAIANSYVSGLKPITQELIDQAREQTDEYGNVSLGVDAVINGLVRLTAENGKFCEAISDFGLAQENTMGLFQQSYIGPTSGYDQFKELDAAIAKAAGMTVKAAEQGGDYVTDGARDAAKIDTNAAQGNADISGNAARESATTARNAGNAVASVLDASGSNFQYGVAASTAQMETTFTNIAASQQASNAFQNEQALQTATAISAQQVLTSDHAAATSNAASSVLSNNVMSSGINFQYAVAASSDYSTSTWGNINTATQGNFAGINTNSATTWDGINAKSISTADAVAAKWQSAADSMVSTVSAGVAYAFSATNVGGSHGGTAITGLANRGGGTYWGGTSVSGGGANIGGGATNPNGGGWGVAASNGASGSFGGSNGYGSAKWGHGGIIDSPQWFTGIDGSFNVAGEAGREAIVPLDDKTSGWAIMQQILPEFGIQAFTGGGMVGRGSGGNNITINATQPNQERETLVIVVDMSGKELTRSIMTSACKTLKMKIGKTK